MTSYEYHRPKTLEEALKLKASIAGARWLAGGTDLLVQFNKRSKPLPPAVISLRNIDELCAIDARDGGLRIGSMVSLTDIAAHPAIRDGFSALTESIRLFASEQIRNVCTLGGNLCNASPAADCAPPLLVHDARIELQSQAGTRFVELANFFRGPGQTAIEAGEVLAAVWLSHPRAGCRSAFMKKGRTQMDVAVASVAVRVEMDGDVCRSARVAAGAVAPLPLRLPEVEAILEGARISNDLVSRARQAASRAVSPITDIRSTETYRRHIVGVFVERALSSLTGGGRVSDAAEVQI